jgi:hypothetical protein
MNEGAIRLASTLSGRQEIIEPDQPITHTSFIENSIEAGNLFRGNANQIRNNLCNKYESAYRKMSQCPYRKDVQTGFARRPS